MQSILIIDDDVSIGNLEQEVLEREGYAVQRAYSGTEALLLLKENKPDLILLDLMLPGISGEELLPQIQEIPVIIISAKAAVEDKVGMLLGGAVDYMTKPFDTNEVLEKSLLGMYGTLSSHGITPDIEIPEVQVIRVLDKNALHRVFDNILNNAAKYSDGDLCIKLCLDGTILFSNKADELNCVQVEKLFDRFFTVDTAKGSTGLGLSIARLLTEKMMNAITKNWVSEKEIMQMTNRALGKLAKVTKIRKMSGGFFSAVYLVETTNEKMVLKIASDTEVKVMRHEIKYIQTEAEILKRFNEQLDIPMPRLIFYDDSGEICKVPYFFMSYIEGKPLCEDTDITDIQKTKVKVAMGTITRKICALKADTFGIPNIPESYCEKNSDFVYLLFDWLLLDAEEKNIMIPEITPEELRTLIRKYGEVLDEAITPDYIHTDTWDGNIMVENGELAGLIDYAAILYGDPLMSHDFHDFGDAPNPYFLQGYGKTEFTQNEKIRIQIYRIWQCLGMVVERGYREYDDPHMYDWVLDDFAKEVKKLKEESIV